MVDLRRLGHTKPKSDNATEELEQSGLHSHSPVAVEGNMINGYCMHNINYPGRVAFGINPRFEPVARPCVG